MNRQALVGLFTVVALLGLFALFVVLENVGTQGRYQIGVHFKSAAGLHRGALVYESGVVVGTVADTILLPKDFTVDVILGINDNVDIPRDARFTVVQPLTGDTTLEIVPPASGNAIGAAGSANPQSVGLLPHKVLPVDQQPQGINPPSITDLLEQGQNEVIRLDRMLALLEKSEPQLLATLQSTLDNFNQLATTGNDQLSSLSSRLNALLSTTQVALDEGGHNLVDLTGQLDQSVRHNRGRFDVMVANLQRITASVAVTVDQVRDLARNPRLRDNLLQITSGLARSSDELSGILGDVRSVTSDPQTQSELRNTVASLDATTQKIDSLLGALGGTSNVPGVDYDVKTPPAGAPAVPASGGSGGPAAPQPAHSAAPPTLSTLHDRLQRAAGSLLAIQFRVAELDAPPAGTVPAPAVPRARGPWADANVILLPHNATSLMIGANDLGSGATTYNVAELKHASPTFTYGGGVLYSNLGGLVRWQPGPLGFEARAYDLRHPTLDVYGNFTLGGGLSLFGGVRDVTEGARRPAVGLQLQF